MKAAIRIASIVSAIVLMASYYASSTSTAEAILYGGYKALEVDAYVTSVDGKAKMVKVTVDYKGVIKEKIVKVKQGKNTEVEFTFPPMEIGLLDYYTACAENLKTDELNCRTIWWWDHNYGSKVYLDTFNTK